MRRCLSWTECLQAASGYKAMNQVTVHICESIYRCYVALNDAEMYATKLRMFSERDFTG